MKWSGVIWLYSLVTYLPLDLFKFAIRYVLAGKAWNNLLQNKTAFTTKKDFGKEEREAQWATIQRSIHGLTEDTEAGVRSSNPRDSTEANDVASEARKRAGMARFREHCTLKGKMEVKANLKRMEIGAMPSHFTV